MCATGSSPLKDHCEGGEGRGGQQALVERVRVWCRGAKVSWVTATVSELTPHSSTSDPTHKLELAQAMVALDQYQL